MNKIIPIGESISNALDHGQSILKRVSVDIFTTESGKEALALDKAHAMDFIVTSLETTDIGGDSLCSLMRRDSELNIVSLLITCAHSPLWVDRAARCGSNEIITEQPAEKITVQLSIPRRQKYRVLLNASVTGQQSGAFFSCPAGEIRSIENNGTVNGYGTRLWSLSHQYRKAKDAFVLSRVEQKA